MTSSNAKPIYILNGPNLNLLGTREPEIYGIDTLDDIEAAAREHAKGLGAAIAFYQTNAEGTLVDQIQDAISCASGIIINPGAYTHTSIALHDSLMACPLPKIELHLSNVHAREAFRRHSYVSPAVNGVICGLGAHGYLLAINAIVGLMPT